MNSIYEWYSQLKLPKIIFFVLKANTPPLKNFKLSDLKVLTDVNK